jgi:hypothetical protein
MLFAENLLNERIGLFSSSKRRIRNPIKKGKLTHCIH